MNARPPERAPPETTCPPGTRAPPGTSKEPLVNRSSSLSLLCCILVLSFAGCSEGEDRPRPLPEDQPSPQGAANGCFAVEGFDGRNAAFLVASSSGTSFSFSAEDATTATPFLWRAADLGTYLLYDDRRHFLTATGESDPAATGSDDPSTTETPLEPSAWSVTRDAVLQSAESLRIDRFRSTGEWDLEPAAADATRFQLRHGNSGLYLGFSGLVAEPLDAAVLTLIRREGCAEFPELSLDATGEVGRTTWDDGDLYGFIDAHSHLLTNKGFGGGGMFHGAPYHRLGVEHALPDCAHSHGEEGRNDIIGFFFDGDVELDVNALLPVITQGRTQDFNHHTDGYPTFTDWPNSWQFSTHQQQYYRWLERAYLSGLRMVVELATGNSILCEFLTGVRAQETLYSCNDMVGVDRAIEAAREMERYIDAQHGGPGEGWFRIVESPAQARDVIRDGKLAVVLGIETSNLFDCFLTPPEGYEPCTEEGVMAALDEYHALGIRVIFPVHKYDNAFSPGDGHRGVIELGNLINSHHYSNFVEDCPFDRHVFDSGAVTFGGLNEPRPSYLFPAPLNMFRFANNPIQTLLPLLPRLQEPGLPGNYCQNATLTPLGERLIEGIMERGMIIDVAHLPQHSVVRTLDILEEAGYPASSTHGDTFDGRIFDIAGFGRISFGGCADLEQPDTMGNGLRNRVALLRERGLYAAPGFAFDMNGFAGARRPRFGEHSGCPQPQPNPITYPFRSFDGAVEFTQPRLADREVDFNTDGMLQIGLLPELIEDARRDGLSDEDLEPLFRSAEAYIRMWELAEERAERLFGARQTQ